MDACSFSCGKPASRLGPPVWSVTLPVKGEENARGTILQATLEVCKDVSSNQVQTTLSLDPASKAEVDSAVSAGWAGGTKRKRTAIGSFYNATIARGEEQC